MTGNNLAGGMSNPSTSKEPPGRGPGDAQVEAEREPTRAELIEMIRISNARARAIEGTDADPLVQVDRILDRIEARAELLEAERLRRRRWLWPFG